MDTKVENVKATRCRVGWAWQDQETECVSYSPITRSGRPLSDENTGM